MVYHGYIALAISFVLTYHLKQKAIPLNQVISHHQQRQLDKERSLKKEAKRQQKELAKIKQLELIVWNKEEVGSDSLKISVGPFLSLRHEHDLKYFGPSGELSYEEFTHYSGDIKDVFVETQNSFIKEPIKHKSNR